MKLIKLLSAIIVLLIVTNVTLTNHAVDQATVVSRLSADISALGKANTLLRASLADLGSLTRLTGDIAAAGFVESPQVVTLPTPASVASAQ